MNDILKLFLFQSNWWSIYKLSNEPLQIHQGMGGIITRKTGSSWCQRCRHWCHHTLPRRQLSVSPMTTKKVVIISTLCFQCKVKLDSTQPIQGPWIYSYRWTRLIITFYFNRKHCFFSSKHTSNVHWCILSSFPWVMLVHIYALPLLQKSGYSFRNMSA